MRGSKPNNREVRASPKTSASYPVAETERESLDARAAKPGWGSKALSIPARYAMSPAW
jgi:hypothetical protein